MTVNHTAKFVAAVVAFAMTSPARAGAPASLTPVAVYGSNRVALDWPAATGALSYNVKRSDSPGGPYALLGNVTATNYSDTTPVTGQKYYYAVTTITSSGESTGFREAAASPGIVVDNTDTANVTSTGSWPVSGLSGAYGTNSQYAASVSGSATATFRFTPSLPFFANYDIYMRWPAGSNRCTATPVEIRYADGGYTAVTVDQTTNSGVWMLLGTFPCAPGTSSSVTIRNDGGSTGSYVQADAIQFVPHLAPWAPRGIAIEDYTVTSFSDECSSLDPAKWTTALGRENVSAPANSGKIFLDITYIGPGTAATASLDDLKDPHNWFKGAVQPIDDRKFGYYETRFRVVQKGGGVDCAFWMQSKGSLLPYEDFEFDSPEAFPDADLATTDLIYGMWDHTGGSPPWRMNKITYDHSWGSQYHTYGMDWRIDNILVHYLDGVEIGRSTAGAVNSIACMAPVDTYLSCYVGNYWQPAASIDGQSMRVDYLRCYQKPGWIGAGGASANSWGDARNWGPDGVPSSGEAAVFNMPVTQTLVAVLGNKQIQSISFEGADVSAMTISGTFQLQLGAGDNGVIQGGISMSSSVGTDQTINAPIVGLQNLSFLNNSRAGAALILNGVIDGTSGSAQRSIHFAANQPIVVTQPFGSHIGDIVKWGTSEFAMPAGSANIGKTIIAQGALRLDDLKNGGQPSGLGASSASPANLQFYSRTKYTNEAQRPRLRYTGPAASTDRGITIGYFCDVILDASGSGPVTWSGPVAFDAGNTGTAVLEFSGTNNGDNTYAGSISDATATNPSGGNVNLKFRKTGAGRWILGAANSWRGATEITDGTLVIGNALVSGGALACSGSSILFNRGNITAASCSFGGGSTYRAEISPGGAATLNVSGNVALGGELDLAVNGNPTPGGTFTLINKTGTGAITGTFSGKPNGSTFTSGDHAWLINYNGGDGNDLVLTLLTHQQAWRHTHFNTTAGEGDAADMADPDSDGLVNLMEFATGTLPVSSNGPIAGLIKNGATLEFTYPRSHAAVADGVTFIVEWSDTLGNDWSSAGVIQSAVPGTDNGTTEQIRATVALPPGNAARFVRLRVTQP